MNTIKHSPDKADLLKARAHTRIFYFAKIYSLVIALILALCQPLHAAPVQNATYEQFEQLVKEKSAQIPELQNLWSWRAKYNEPVYLGGGILRGLLRWLEEKLRNHSFKEVQQMNVPTAQALLIQKDADLDLFHDQVGADWFKKNLREYGDWDILTKDFSKESVQAGGPTIEKVRVSPDQIDDPLGGLRAFYNGKLNYVDVSELTFIKFRGGTKLLNNNMKSALALRALRFANDMPSTEIDSETSKTLHHAINSEISKIEPGNYWIQKALTKFHTSTGRDTAKTIQVLRDYGLLNVLARNGYSLGNIKSKSPVDRKYLLLQLPPEEISDEDFQVFKRSSKDISANIEGMKHLLTKADSSSRVTAILDPAVNNPNSAYKAAISTLMKDSVYQISKADLSLSDLERLRTLSNRIDTNIELIKVGISRARSSKEFLDAIHLETRNPSNEYKEAVSHLVSQSVNRFMALTPSESEIKRLNSILKRLETRMMRAREGIARAQTAKDFFAAVNPGIFKRENRYPEDVRALIQQSVEKFAKLNPTAKEMNRFKKISSDIHSNITLMTRAIEKSKSAGEFLEAISPGVSNPSEAYKNEISKLISSFADRFVSLQPSDSEIKRLKKMISTVYSGIAVIREAAQNSKSAEQFLKALSPEVSNPNPMYLNEIATVAIQNRIRFLELNPSESERSRFEKISGTSLPAPNSSATYTNSANDQEQGRFKCMINALKSAVSF